MRLLDNGELPFVAAYDIAYITLTFVLLNYTMTLHIIVNEGKIIMATIQIRIDDTMKMAADDLFNSLGLDISTAVRIFLAASINNDGIPFNIKRTKSVDQAMSDEDIIGISNRIMKKNEEAYKVLAQ